MVEKDTFADKVPDTEKLSLQYGLVHATHTATGPSVADKVEF